MHEFSYTATADSGARVRGVISAENPDRAREQLAAQGLIPGDVRPARGSARSWITMEIPLLPGGGVGTDELILFTKQFRAMFGAGVSVTSLLEVLEAQSPNPRLKQAIRAMARDVRGGASLHQAFGRHPGVFPRLYLSLIRAGEASGKLPDILERVVRILAHEQKVKRDVAGALRYPATVVLALVGAFFVLLNFVVPKFAEMFRNAGVELPLPTRICIGMYEGLQAHWPLLGGGAAAAGLGLWLWMRTERGRLLRDWLLLRLPVVGPLVTKAALSRFASTFAMLQASGVGVLESLDILAETIGNAAMAREFGGLRERLQEGRGIAGPLRASPHFTPMLVNMVAIGEESGNLSEMLAEVSSHYDDEVAFAVAGLSAAIGPILMVLLTAVVGFFAMAIFLPMWDLARVSGH